MQSCSLKTGITTDNLGVSFIGELLIVDTGQVPYR